MNVAEIFRCNGKLVYIHPKTKEITPAPEGAWVGQKVEVFTFFNGPRAGEEMTLVIEAEEVVDE